MSRFYELVTEHVRNLGAYTPGKPIRQAEQESGVPCIKLASNENPFGPSPQAVKAMQAVLAESNFYPDNDANDLRVKLAERHQVKPEQIVLTAGSTSLLGVICRTLLAPGLEAVTSAGSFIVYPIATKAAGGRLIEVPMREYGFDLDAVLAAINPRTRLIFLANPNNPTGSLIEAGELDRFLERVPENVIVVVDEAYCDFAEHFANLRGVEYSHAFDYVHKGRNVVVLRTFSKAHGLAGLRVGYGVGPAELMAYFARLRTTFAVSILAQAAAMAALDDEAHILTTVRNNAEQAGVLIRGLADTGFSPLPTWANFIYCDVGEDAHAVAKRLQERGIIIRSLAPWGLPQAIRITIGKPEHNQAFLKAFGQGVQAMQRPVASL
jgi:histidinol-phosphate aminotransferase